MLQIKFEPKELQDKLNCYNSIELSPEGVSTIVKQHFQQSS
jgi:hypothetical protein